MDDPAPCRLRDTRIVLGRVCLKIRSLVSMKSSLEIIRESLELVSSVSKTVSAKITDYGDRVSEMFTSNSIHS